MLPILSTHQLTFNKISVLQHASSLCSVPRGERQPAVLILAGPSQPQAKGSLKTSLFSDTGPLNGDLFCLTGVLKISCLPWSRGSSPASAALDTSAWE